jgi:hypothetical protein
MDGIAAARVSGRNAIHPSFRLPRGVRDHKVGRHGVAGGCVPPPIFPAAY